MITFAKKLAAFAFFGWVMFLTVGGFMFFDHLPVPVQLALWVATAVTVFVAMAYPAVIHTAMAWMLDEQKAGE